MLILRGGRRDVLRRRRSGGDARAPRGVGVVDTRASSRCSRRSTRCGARPSPRCRARRWPAAASWRCTATCGSCRLRRGSACRWRGWASSCRSCSRSGSPTRSAFAAAKDLLFTAEPVSGERAYQLGFATRLVGARHLAIETERLAERIAANAPSGGAADEAGRPAHGAFDASRWRTRSWRRRACRVSRSEDVQEGLAALSRAAGSRCSAACRRRTQWMRTSAARDSRDDGATGRNQGHRSHPGAGRPVLHDAARRHGRRDREDRGAGARRRNARLGAVRRRLEQLLPRRQPRQEERRARSEDAGGRRRAARADRERRRAGRELPARQPQPARLRLRATSSASTRARSTARSPATARPARARRSRATTSSSRARPASWT